MAGCRPWCSALPWTPRHACPCDLILEHLALSDLGDEETEWQWSCHLNRRETMSWCVAAADMRAREELLLACSDGGREKLEWLHVASVKFRGRSLFQNTVELSKMIGALDGNENIMIEII
ncbi:hypothetical protein PVAP13_7KG342500 [Panicum virgatum]|uniref:Uncharacterized protein n=1 Tax=Panicum virgatum TaxID=38727 RepID=A0A8T0QN94_PANVG|nr:hypothetical protein PVAP13_7KG342500 [Panicum virgatum]